MMSQSKLSRVFGYLALTYLIAYSVAAVFTKDISGEYNVETGGVQLSLYDIIVVVSIAGVTIPVLTGLRKEPLYTRYVFGIILAYFAYQVIIVLPLSFFDPHNTKTLKNLFRALASRFHLVIIMLLYWYSLPAFKRSENSFKLFSLAGVFLFGAGLINVLSGRLSVNSSGALQSLDGIAVFVFAFLLVTNLSFFAADRNNIAFALMALSGFVFVNHRSGYIGLMFIFPIALLLEARGPGRKKRLFSGALILGLGYALLSNITYISENFSRRFEQAFVYQYGTGADRLARWLLGWTQFIENPLNGSLLSGTWYLEGKEYNMAPHNFIVEILTTEGIAGILFYTFIFYYIFKAAIKNRRDGITAQMMYMLLFFLSFSFLNYTFNNPRCDLFMLFPIAVILYRYKLQDESVATRRRRRTTGGPNSMKRILLFVNLPPNDAAVHIGQTQLHHAGWINSFIGEMRKAPGIRLGIAFPLRKSRYTAFTERGIQYFVLPELRSTSGLLDYISNLGARLEPLESVRYFLQAVGEFRPDLVHIFGTEKNFGLMIPKLSVPCVIHLQGNLTVGSRKFYAGIGKFDSFWHGSVIPMLRGQSFFHSYLLYKRQSEREREIFTACGYFMGRTDWNRRLVATLAPKARYFHCDEMLRDEFFRHRWKGRKSGERVVLATIRPNLFKGFETLCEAIHIANSASSAPIIAKVAGISADDELVRITRKVLGEHYPESRIFFLGKLDEKQLAAEMVKASMFAHPSHIDNSPNSVCEAMAVGMPIVATYAGGIPSLLLNGKEGLLVQDGDPYTFAGAILDILHDKSGGARLGENARRRALKRNDPRAVLKSVLKIYKEILGEKAK